MGRLVVTVKRKGDSRVRDVEVPADVGAGELAALVARTLRWDSDAAGQPLTFAIEAQPPGRLLEPHESLADAGVGNGAWLVLHPLARSAGCVWNGLDL